MRDTQILGPHPTGIRNFPPLFAVKSDLKSRVAAASIPYTWLRRHYTCDYTVWLVTNNVGHGVLIFSRLHRSM